MQVSSIFIYALYACLIDNSGSWNQSKTLLLRINRKQAAFPIPHYRYNKDAVKMWPTIYLLHALSVLSQYFKEYPLDSYSNSDSDLCNVTFCGQLRKYLLSLDTLAQFVAVCIDIYGKIKQKARPLISAHSRQ